MIHFYASDLWARGVTILLVTVAVQVFVGALLVLVCCWNDEGK